MSSFPRRAALAAGVLLTGAAPAACQALAGLEPPSFVEQPEAGPSPDASVVDECRARVPEPRSSPAVTDVPGDLTFAVEFFQLPSRVEPEATRLCPSPAIDLDGVDTCATARLPDGGTAGVRNACRSRVEQCDVNGGGDSVLDQVAKDFLGQLPTPQSDVNVGLRDGRVGLLLELSNYNFLPDDNAVSFAVLSSVGTALEDGGLPLGDGGIVGPAPKWDGSDIFVPERQSLFDSRPAFRAQRAYVTGGVLVARFARGKFTFGGSASELEATEIVITARLVPDGKGRPTRLDRGRVALRVPSDTLASYVAGRLADGASVCKNGPVDKKLRETLTTIVCDSLDLSGVPGTGTPDDLCGAMSFAAGFYATSVLRTEATVEVPVVPPPAPCPAEIPWPPKCDQAP